MIKSSPVTISINNTENVTILINGKTVESGKALSFSVFKGHSQGVIIPDSRVVDK